MKKLLLYLYYLGFFICFMISCNEEKENLVYNGDHSDSVIDKITVYLANRNSESEILDNEEYEGETPIMDIPTEETVDIDKLVPYTLDFQVGDKIFVSQHTDRIPAFQREEDIFIFENYEAEANWDEGYNFSPPKGSTPMEWNTMFAKGTFNTLYSLYGLHFPLEDKIRQFQDNENSPIYYSVLSDQSNIENLKKSDILGAFHSTSIAFDRLMFKMYHLMNYLRIRLYVPVYDDELKTGFREDALDYATIVNVTNKFDIEWSSNISSDQKGPSIQEKSLDESENNEIKMYLHPETKHQEVKISYKNFTPIDQGIDDDYDNVRIYDFSVIVPKQPIRSKEDGTSFNFWDTEFLNFYIKSNAGQSYRYYFSSSQNGPESTASFNLSQGIFQYIELYVPRIGNEALVINAKVSKWNQNDTFMLLTEEKND